MHSETTAILRLSKATLGYGADVVLDGVDLEIGEGGFWFVLGPNGSGKTTLLRAILGLLDPLRGRVWRDPVHATAARIGFVPQHCGLSPALPTTLREFVSLGAIGGDRPRANAKQDLAWALDCMGLEGLETRNYWSLSGGQRQRALVARALVRRPSLLVLDEPTEGMDPGSHHAFLGTLDRLHEKGSTLLFVTHDLAVASSHATHIALVRDGGVFAGPRATVLKDSLLDEIFGVSA